MGSVLVFGRGVTLNVQQQEAFVLAHEWFFNKPDTPFVLTGSAGTGKSYTAQRIIQSLRELHRQATGKVLRVALSAPTHKARSVLERFAAEAGLTDVHICTLHSLLHLVPGKSDEHGHRRLERSGYSSEPHYLEFGLVLVDESSMISEELFGFIPQDIPTIFMGDRCQLCPVEVEKDGEPEDSPIFSLPLGINLTQIMRYEGSIAEYASAIRQDIYAQFPPRVHSQGNLTKIPNLPEWEAALLDAFTHHNFQHNPDAVRVLAWTNNRVAQLNQKIRDRFFDPKSEFCTGERLMAKEPIILGSGRNKEVLLPTCGECTITRSAFTDVRMKSNGHLLNFDGWHVEADSDTGKRLSMTLVARTSWEQVRKFVGEFKKEILATPDRRERASLWQEYYELLEQLNLVVRGNSLLHRLQFAASLTIHMSQGSTFQHVFVDQSNIFGCRIPKTRNQLLYVAATRASDSLTVYSKI